MSDKDPFEVGVWDREGEYRGALTAIHNDPYTGHFHRLFSKPGVRSIREHTSGFTYRKVLPE